MLMMWLWLLLMSHRVGDNLAFMTLEKRVGGWVHG